MVSQSDLSKFMNNKVHYYIITIIGSREGSCMNSLINVIFSVVIQVILQVLSWLSRRGLFPVEYIAHIDPDFFKRIMPEVA